MKKDLLERQVVFLAKEYVLNDDIISSISDPVVELQKQENTVIPYLQSQLREVEKGIENMLNAIQQGIITSSTKRRIDEREQRKEDIEISIVKEKIAKTPLTFSPRFIFIGGLFGIVIRR